MNPFRRKSERKSASEPHPANRGGHLLSETHRVTLELARAETFAAMLAKSRASHVMEVSDLLAGMYICNWDRLSHYWEEEDREEIETFLRGICRISPERWHSWIEIYDGLRRKDERWHLLRPLERLKKATPPEAAVRPSSALASVFKRAEELAPTRDSVGGRNMPILTSECVLLCIVRSFGSEITRKLAGTGLDAGKLERDALFPRRAPLV
ncbi:MAG TPA: hypothetical protein VN885_00025 [Candidatus Acidoferrales bacterium]|nr:hypothetical protein [Candidatus Acidoferrales bacterium]